MCEILHHFGDSVGHRVAGQIEAKVRKLEQQVAVARTRVGGSMLQKANV